MKTTLLLAALTALPVPALACGGLFCNGTTTPTVQTAERVLFEVHGDGTITAVVEIQFEGEGADFGWVVPLPHAIDPDAVGTAPAGVFDELEELTAPRFRAPSYATADALLYMEPPFYGCNGCARSYTDGMTAEPFVPEGVEVVGEAVVGPYEIEIITAEEALDLTVWLQQAGYNVPSTAMAPIERYLDLDMAFLGLKLSPDLPEGPIDAITFTFEAEDPMLPLLLTAVAAVPNMDIITYVAAETRYAPDNYGDARIDDGELAWTTEGTNYDERLGEWLDNAGGAAFATEFAAPTDLLNADVAAELLTQPYLTRFRTLIDPAEMTHDPCWTAAPGLPDVSSDHVIADDAVEVAGFSGSVLLLLLVRRRFVRA